MYEEPCITFIEKQLKLVKYNPSKDGLNQGHQTILTISYFLIFLFFGKTFFLDTKNVSGCIIFFLKYYVWVKVFKHFFLFYLLELILALSRKHQQVRHEKVGS